ncbi:hypothetical protein EI94DRAFT_1737669 [Lactarius quietus]|nr:hypothetical protein EI94DRAFT_1737669 [Lactarius quietus]
MMDPSQANPREYLRQAIDAEIKSLEGSIRTLRHRRNALAPVSSLPTEVVLIIFSLVREDDIFLSWLQVAHVCHQWREIALNLPYFWSHVDFTTVGSAGAAEILTRAKKAPLHLMADIPFSRWDEARFSKFRKELHDHTFHIRHLQFSAESIQFSRTLNSLTSPAPTLESLKLMNHGSADGTTFSQGFIPETLFDESTPRLARLELSNYAINWKSPLLRGLKYLDIKSPYKRPRVSIWLEALDEMPQLQTLILQYASPISPPNTSLPFDVERAVTLPSLTFLDITSRATDCGLALGHLVLPALTSLCLVVDSCFPDGSDVPETLPYVARHAKTHPLHSVFVRSNTMCVEMLACSTSPDFDIYDTLTPEADMRNEISTPVTVDPVQVEFSVRNVDWSPETHTEVFDTMMAALPLDSLVVFTAQRHTQLDEQFWLHHAPQWPLLQHIRLAPRAAHGFRELLLDDRNARLEIPPLLPSLKKLILFDTRLSARRTLHLCDVLMERVEQGVPLETLDLSRCIATGRAVELLSEIVVEVLGPDEEPEDTVDTRYPRWDAMTRGLFVRDDSSGLEDNDEDNIDPSNDDEDHWGNGEIFDDPLG